MKEKEKIVELEEKELSFSDEPLVFGRAEDCDVCIEDTSMSQRHCAIRTWDDLLLIKDLNSTNGTKVNGLKIDRIAILKPGDKVQIGNVIFEI
ncbi:MAG: FHA domain-containing protein [Verrucomicrobiota bacterium]|nr:FHA domain-containing protein [Verrucomicrobiota bacterium]